MWGIFQAVFTIGQIPADLIDAGIYKLQNWLEMVLPQTFWNSLLINGIIGGVGAILVFLPLIIVLFFFISVLRESGYLSRISVLFNNSLKRIGLTGQSIVPLTMGFGCNVPAIMALKTLESRRQKIITTMMIPFLSCSATLPIYTLLIAAFIEQKWRGTVLFALYVAGILISFLTGSLINKFLKPEKTIRPSFLPNYKMPNWRKVTEIIWSTTKSFLLKAGKIIVPVSIIMWILFSFPQANDPTIQIENSYAAKIGTFVEPVFKPIGFDWRINTSLFGALGAKEIFISTLGIFYSLDTTTDEGLIHALQNDPHITPLTAVMILIFMLIYSPCLPVIATVKEQFGLKWAIIIILYPTALAWTVCFLIYQSVLLLL